jgi:pimeloyl-ACP methyl ester carboxylesterase
MDAPPIRYLTTSDGKRLAYSVCGGGRPLVFVPNLVHHIGWSSSLWPEWIDGLASRFRMVQFNFHGQGPSSRGLTPEHSRTDWERELAAVMDELHLDSAVLFGTSTGAHVALAYAIAHPERVDALIVNCASVAMRAWPEAFWQGLSDESWPLFLESIVPRGLTPVQTQTWLVALGELFTPEDFRVAIRTTRLSDLKDDLGHVQTHALVLHPRRYSQLPVEEGARLSAGIANARFVVIDGDSQYGAADQAFRAIDSFVASLPPRESTSTSPADRLSAREREVLRLLSAGKTNQHIADELVISLNTVNRHVSNIYAKTGVANRAEAVGYAHRNGLAG